jgi:hypothetical protein
MLYLTFVACSSSHTACPYSVNFWRRNWNRGWYHVIYKNHHMFLTTIPHQPIIFHFQQLTSRTTTMRQLSFNSSLLVTLRRVTKPFIQSTTGVESKPPFHFPSRLFSSTPTSTPGSAQLQNKTVLITGASRGIGAEIARHFAREGAQCLLVGRNEPLLQSVRDELHVSLNAGSREQKQHRVIVGDVGDVEFWAGMKKEVRNFFIISLLLPSSFKAYARTLPPQSRKTLGGKELREDYD